MLTHYTKRTPPKNERFQTTLESVIYDLIPNNRLITIHEFAAYVRDECRRQGDPLPSDKAVENTLENLAGRNYVYSIHGSRLDRLIGTL